MHKRQRKRIRPEDSESSQSQSSSTAKRQKKRNGTQATSSMRNDDGENSVNYGGSATNGRAHDAKKKQQVKGKRANQHTVESEDEDEFCEDEDGELYNDNAANHLSQDEKLAQENRQALVGQIVRYALFCEGTKHVVKREEVSKIMKQQNAKGIAIQPLLDDANKLLKEIFGMELVPLAVSDEDSQNKSNKKRTAASKAHTVVLAQEPVAQVKLTKPELVKRCVQFVDEERLPVDGLLVVILALIEINNQHSHTLDEEVLWQHLNTLGLKQDMVHPELGHIGKLVDQLARQHYLEKKRRCRNDVVVEERGKAVFLYGKGGRAMQEIDKDAVLQFARLMSGSSDTVNLSSTGTGTVAVASSSASTSNQGGYYDEEE